MAKIKGNEKRLRLFRAQEGKCHWCRRGMVLRWRTEGGKPAPDEITIDHLDDRFSAERGRHPWTRRQVGACYDCNHRRGRESQAAQPIEVLRERSRRHHRTDETATHGTQP